MTTRFLSSGVEIINSDFNSLIRSIVISFALGNWNLRYGFTFFFQLIVELFFEIDFYR